ncbi:MAG: asparagine synthase (glutamine-hydrolyzing) [Nitrospira sp. WS238]|nr:asparagine synthase (glutamine-hydrolyzing) [Nitrospira sp. WS238]
MCGIAGYCETTTRSTREKLEATAEAMAATLHHRGPNDSGVWSDPSAGIALAHRRLSVMDLSPFGHQPMHSASGRYALSFNGEIYNFRALRSELECLGHMFRGHSDTEIMLASFSQWGVHGAVERFNGMFAFAVWDRDERRLHLARDRFGEKPLYYGWMGKTFLFASELKALQVHPEFEPNIDRDVLALYFRHGYIPAPYSIYCGISKVLPGTIVTLNAESNSLPTSASYWSVRAVAEQGSANPFTGTDAEAMAHLDHLLRDAVKLRMEADVPLGAFLSGGIDSSTIVALMQAQCTQPVRTFSIGFHEEAYNEADYAKAVAKHLGTHHTELYVAPEKALAVIPRLPTLYDEPFSDASQIPTFLVSQLARRDVTVCLSGDAGDELFAGYDTYLHGVRIWNLIGWLPHSLRMLSGRGLTALLSAPWEFLLRLVEPICPKGLRLQHQGLRLMNLAELLSTDCVEAMHRKIITHWNHSDSVVIGAAEPPTTFTDRTQWGKLSDALRRMMYTDSITYLPDDILVKVDRASMGVSLEARVPLLDHRVAEFAWQLPVSMTVRDGRGKWILRQVLAQYVPPMLTERPKKGFAVPISAWLRGPLKEWGEALLDRTRLNDQGFLNPDLIRGKWSEHQSGEADWRPLWDALMFQAWFDSQQQHMRSAAEVTCSL